MLGTMVQYEEKTPASHRLWPVISCTKHGILKAELKECGNLLNIRAGAVLFLRNLASDAL